MSPPAAARAMDVAAAIDALRARLPEHTRDYTVALLALAKANAAGSGEFNAPSPQDALALQALALWRRDAQRALRRLRAVSGDAPGKQVAEKWLKTMVAALNFQRQSLSLADPTLAAQAAASARKQTARYHLLETKLDRALA
jgi:hypothetical protein